MNRVIHTEETRRRVKELYEAGMTAEEIAAEMGLRIPQVDGLKRRMKLRSELDPAAPDFETARESRERRDQIASLRQQVKEAAREETAIKRTIEAIKRYAPQLPPPDPPKPTKPPKTASRETMVIDLADWHYGEQVDLERMRGLNEYDTAIASKRVDKVIATIGDIKRRLEKGGGWYFEDAVVVLGGDMVTGWIHDLERDSDDTIVVSTLNCADLIFHALQDLSVLFPALHVTGVVGNHGRLAKRKEYKDPTRNWDYLAYKMVEWRMGQFENVAFNFPAAHSMVINIRGHNIFITHGDEYRAQFSLPYYAIDRASRGVQAIEASRGAKIDYSFIHHWHSGASTPLAGGQKNIVMPSLKGGDEYALEKLGVCSPAGQWMAGFKEDVGMTHEWPLYCQT